LLLTFLDSFHDTMKIAILDLGTNTFHLLITEVTKDKALKILFKSKVAVKLGEGGIGEKVIAEIPFARGIRALKHYSEIIKQHRPAKVFAFATSGIRSATNRKKFIAEAKRVSGISIKVIPGSKEAELICKGVRQCVNMNDERQLIMDIGGGSTEFIIANASKIFWKHSFDIGASRLLETFRPSNPITASEVRKLEKYLTATLSPLDASIKKFPVTTLIGSSGSFDTLAEMIGWKFHRKDVLKNVTTLRISLEDYYRLHEILLNSTTSQRIKMKGLIKMRVDMIVLASICTNFILKRYGLESMILSKYALKEGALWDIVRRMNPAEYHR
jgi:exopolyphosphatase / guanosine-5'-triphosphate,3'-diphosphate pyrophosphatase